MDTTKPEDTGISGNPDPDEKSLFSERDWITVDEAVIYFRALGLPRSPEAIRGYCRHCKLEATTTQGIKGEQHVIKRESARVYIEDRKKVLEAMSRDMSEQDGLSRKLTVHSETTRQIPEEPGTSQNVPSEDLAEKEAEITKLRDEIMSLKIDKQARDQIVIMLRDEREALAREASGTSHRVGELEATLRIAAPEQWEQLVGDERSPRATFSIGRDRDAHAEDKRASTTRRDAV